MADKREIHSAVRINGTTNDEGKFRKGELVADPDELEAAMTPDLYERLTEKGVISGFAAPKSTRKGGGSSAQSADDFSELTVPDLKEQAREAGVEGFSTMRKDELIEALSSGK